MRKLHLVLIFIILGPPATSQGLRFIVFADPQINWIKPEMRSVENAGVRAGFDAGFEMDNFFSENYAFTTGLSINSIGGKLRFNEEITVKFESSTEIVNPGNVLLYRLSYVNLPLGLKFTTREIGYSTIYAKLGMGGHFNIRANADLKAFGIEDESLRDEIEFFNISYHFGAGVHYSLGGVTSLVAGIEYRHRFVDIATNRRYKALLNSISLRVGLLF